MATYYASGPLWNLASNWGTTSGASDGAIPTSADIAIFDANSVNMAIDVNALSSKIEMQAGFTGTLTQNSGRTISCSSSSFAFQCDGGSFIGGDSLIDCDGPVRINGGSFTSTSGILDIQARNNNDFQRISGTFNHNNGEIKITGSNHHQITTNAANPLYKLTINTCPTCIHSGTYYIVNDLNFVLCQNINATIFARGNILGPGYAGGNGMLTIDGTGVQQYSLVGISSVTVNKASGSLDIQNNIQVGGTDWIHTAGTINWNGYGVTFVNSATHVTVLNGSFYNVVVNKGATNTFSLGGTTASIFGNLTLTALANFNSGVAQLHGNLISNDTSMGGSATIELKGSGVQSYSGITNAVVGANIIINKTGGSFNLLSKLIQEGTGNDVTLQAGEINFGSYDFIVKDNFYQNGGVVNEEDGLLEAEEIFLYAGTFNEGPKGLKFTKDMIHFDASLSFNRHQTGGINTTTGLTPTATLDLNGHEITHLTHNRGTFSLNISTPPVVKGNLNWNGSGAQITSTSQTMEVHGNIYLNGMRGGDETILNINGDTDQEIIQQATTGAVSDRAIVSVHINKPAGRLYLRSTVGNLNFDRDFINNIGDRVIVDGDFETRFTDNSSSGAAQMKSGGIKFPNFVWERGAEDMTLQDDLKTGNYKRISGSYGSSWINSAGKTIEIYGNYSVVGDASQGIGVVHNLRPNMKMVGPGDHTMSTTDPQGNIDAGNWIIAKDDGASVTIDTNVLHDNDSSDDEVNVFLVKSGTLFVKDVDFLIEGILSIDKAAKVYKTDLATVTATSGIIGEIGDSAVLPVPPVEEEEETLADIIKENLKNPFRVKGDNGEVEQHRLRDQIEAEKYLASKEAFKNNTGLKFSRLKPGGTTS